MERCDWNFVFYYNYCNVKKSYYKLYLYNNKDIRKLSLKKIFIVHIFSLLYLPWIKAYLIQKVKTNYKISLKYSILFTKYLAY